MRISLFLGLWLIAFGSIAQTEKADSLRNKASLFSQSFQLDSAIMFHKMAAEQYMIAGDSDLYYRSQADISYELLRSNKLEEAEKLARESIENGSKVMSAENLAATYRMVAHSNNLLGNREESLKYYDLTLETLERQESVEAKRIKAVVNSDKGIMNYYAGDYAEAERFWKNALDILGTMEMDQVAKNFCEISMNLTAVLRIRAAHNEALDYLARAELAATNHMNNPETMLAHIYNSMGDLHDLTFSLEKSTDYYLKAKKVLEKNPPNQSSILNLVNLSYNLTSSGEYETAIDLAKKALEQVRQAFEPEHEWVAVCLVAMANAYEYANDPEKAEELLKSSMDFLNKTGRRYNPNQVHGMNTYGGYLQRMGRHKDGVEIMRRVMHISDSIYQGQGQRHASNAELLGQLFYNVNQIDSALYYYQISLIANTREFSDSDWLQNPDRDTYYEMATAFDALFGKALSLFKLYYQTGEARYLLTARETLKEMDYQSLMFKQISSSFFDQVKTQKHISESQEVGLRLNQKLYELFNEEKYLDEAFYYIESGKSNLTINRLQESIALNTINVPQKTLALNDDLLRSIAYYEEELYYMTGINDTVGIENATIQLSTLRLKSDSLKRVINDSYPDFFELKFKNNYSTIQNVQDQLKDDELLYSYDWHDTLLYIFELSSDKVILHKSEVDSLFRKDIRKLLNLIKYPSFTESAAESYLEQSQKLIDILLPGIREDKEHNRILIIPDEIISTIPFEAMAVDQREGNSGYGNLNYLIDHFELRYANSASLWLRQEEGQSAPKSPSIAAFAPVFDTLSIDQVVQLDTSRSGLNALAYTEKEVNDIALHFETQRFLGKDANEKNFRESAPDYSIVHIASHGLLNKENPLFSKLVFSPFETDSVNDGFLNTQELYAMSIPAQLVVLSACDSGVGEAVTGEGILSLANAFFYAGSKSLVMSLWTANDQSTATIISDFYANLAQGQLKSEALRNAKLNFLNQADDIRRHPHFWAHLVVNGNNEPIKAATNWSVYFLLIVGLGIITLMAARRRRLAKR